jgi:hypothetical protein
MNKNSYKLEGMDKFYIENYDSNEEFDIYFLTQMLSMNLLNMIGKIKILKQD